MVRSARRTTRPALLAFRRTIRPALYALLILIATACARNAPQDTLTPDGPVARQQDALFRPVFWIAAVIFFFVEGLILYAVFKFRDHAGREEPKQIHGNTRLELTWTLIPALILLGVAIPTVATIFDSAPARATDQIHVKVNAHQWWWEYEYTDFTPKVVTANELVIPVNKPVYLELHSADVIHSFWIPKLAGKQDVVPGRTNQLVIEAERPDQTYLGQCAEFCSISHANMRLRVITRTPAAFAEWVRGQQAPAPQPADGEAIRGKELFSTNACVSCHTISPGIGGTTGPNLAHLASRSTFASAVYDTNRENLTEWVAHARQQKHGVVMPDFDRPLPAGQDPGNVPGFKVLTADEIRAIVTYLLTLI